MGGLVGLAASPKREAGIAEYQEHEPRQAIAAFYASLACGLYLTLGMEGNEDVSKIAT